MKRKIFTGLLIALVLATTGLFLWEKYSNSQKEVAGITKYYIKRDTVKTSRQKDSTEIASLRATIITYQMMKNSDDTTIAQLRNEVKDAKDNLDTYMALYTSTAGKLAAALRDTQYVVSGPDSTVHTAKTFKYNDSWLDMTGIISDSAYIDYTVRNKYNIKLYNKRSGFLGFKSDLYAEVHSLNPRASTLDLTVYRVEKPRKRFYETTAFKMLVGAAGGFYLGSRVH